MTTMNCHKVQTLTFEALIPERYDLVSVLSVLIAAHDIEIEILMANLATEIWEHNWVKLKLLGSNQQFFQSLSYLTALGIKVRVDRSKPVRTKPTSTIEPQQSSLTLAA